ncbi:3-dehydroquinate synthase [Clostridia bacterium]|nr:3-dehydroquinate synthase [Clostridia bacterium]
MKTIDVTLGDRSYEIQVASGSLTQERLSALGENLVVVTDENVWRLYGGRFPCVKPIVLTAGESTKSLETLGFLYSEFAMRGLNRGGTVVAFGGGVVGDAAGFAAATYMRGVKLVQIPTTLLAQVDSSVGGKTAINIPQGKNLAGAFYQPSLVLIDPDTLKTLDVREIRSGMAEVIKYAAIRSPKLLDMNNYDDIIAECCRVKAEIVARDERDFGERMLLNFGHTFGHAVEAAGNFQRHNHGEAVAIGMVLAAEIGEVLGVTQRSCADLLRNVCKAHGLDIHCHYPPEALLPYCKLDKKSSSKSVNFVFLRGIGEAFVENILFEKLEEAASW